MGRFDLCAPRTRVVVILGGFFLSLGSCSNGETTVAGSGGRRSDAAGAAGGNSGGSGGNTTGKGGSGGSSPMGGSAAAGGSAASGGTSQRGGASGAGGAAGAGGMAGSGGRPDSGGTSGSGGSAGSGGSGGVTNLGGTQSTGGSRRDASPDLSPDTNRASGGNGTGGRGTTGGSGAGGSAAGGSGTGGSASGGTTGSTINDGCKDELAKGITISEIAVFQAGKISVMKSGTAATPKTAKGAEIIQGKDALFRIYVTVDSGFQSRDLSARLMLNGQSLGYSAKATLSASSTELAAANSFNILVPASAITAALDYQVQIVECGTGSGTDHAPIFPASGVASLATRKTGVVKVTMLPVTSGGVTPTLDQTFVDAITKVMDSMYPTSGTQITVSTTPITGCTVTAATASDGVAWSDCLDTLMARRRSDKPASDVYYVAVLKPSSTFAAFCGDSCITGISTVATVTTPNYRISLIDGY